MKTASPALQTLLYATERHKLVDLWTFAFADGTRRWTTGDAMIVTAAGTFTPGPGIKREEIGSETGLVTDGTKVTVYPDGTLIGGISMFRAAMDGLWDGVRVTLQRAYCGDSLSDAMVGVVTEFEGYVDLAEPGPTEIRLSVKSVLSRLEVQIPKRLTTAQCPYQLGDVATCGVILASFTHARTVAAGSSAATIVLSSSSTMAVAGSWITLTSGVLAGTRRMVRSVTGSTLTLAVALPSAPAIGDGVSVVRGCDKTLPTCDTVFGNKLKMGGFPFTPRTN